MYSKKQVNPITCSIMKQNADFQEGTSELRILPHLCPPKKFLPLIRAFKLAISLGFSSWGIGMSNGQNLRLLALLNKE